MKSFLSAMAVFIEVMALSVWFAICVWVAAYGMAVLVDLYLTFVKGL